MCLSPNKSRILVVEDESIVARDIAQQLQDLGFESAGIASNARQAVQMVADVEPDLVLMDIQLGGDMDGIAAAAIIRERFNLPVVFITAYSADEILERAKLTEPFGYILKPFSVRELYTTLTMALYKHQAECRLHDATHRLKSLSRRVLEVQEMERRRIAIELHDELGQSLTAIKINLQLSERLKDDALRGLNRDTIHIVEDVLQQVRRLAANLRPSVLDDLGLPAALRWLSEQSANRSGFSVNFHHVRTQPRLAADIETACFRIVQEALTNITRHAQAKEVAIRLDRDADHLVLRIVDNGRGFDLSEMRIRALAGDSVGVLGMQERADLIEGQLSIETCEGQGTTVLLRCPWRDHEEYAQ